jgi:hypothetical protein
MDEIHIWMKLNNIIKIENVNEMYNVGQNHDWLN